MANEKVLCEYTDLKAIADAIRDKTSSTDDITIYEMPTEIAGISGGEDVTTETVIYTNELATLQTKITALEGALEGKAAGGSNSYDTCTINITSPGGALYGYCATCFDGLNIIYQCDCSTTNLGNITIENVICGSSFAVIHLVDNGTVSYDDNLTVVGVRNYLRGSVFIAPTALNSTANIHIGNNAGGGAD